jgi:hypothetical protein
VYIVNVVIYDMASLDFQWGPGQRSLRLVTSRGNALSWLDLETGVDPRDAAFLACDDALERGRVAMPEAIDAFSSGDATRRLRCRVGLYNPYTAQVSIGAVPRTKIFDGAGALEVPVQGLFGELTDDELVLSNGGVLHATTVSMFELTRRLESHAA